MSSVITLLFMTNILHSTHQSQPLLPMLFESLDYDAYDSGGYWDLPKKDKEVLAPKCLPDVSCQGGMAVYYSNMRKLLCQEVSSTDKKNMAGYEKT